MHSNKANKRVLLEELKRSKSVSAPAPRGEATLVQRLTDSRDQLNAHAETMHVVHEPSELTPFRLLGHLIATRNATGQADYGLQAPEVWTPLQVEKRRELILEMVERMSADGAPDQHPWRGVGRDALDPSEMDKLRRMLDAMSSDLQNAIQAATRVSALFGLAQVQTVGDFETALAMIEAAVTMPEWDREALQDQIWECFEAVTEIISRGERFAKLRL